MPSALQAPAPAAGGRAEWAPRVMPPIGTDLTSKQKLTCAFRILAQEGFTENIAGHIHTEPHKRRDDAAVVIYNHPHHPPHNRAIAAAGQYPSRRRRTKIS